MLGISETRRWVTLGQRAMVTSRKRQSLIQTSLGNAPAPRLFLTKNLLDSIPRCRLQSFCCAEPALRFAVQARVGRGVQGGTQQCPKQVPHTTNAVRASNFRLGAPRRCVHCGRYNGRSRAIVARAIVCLSSVADKTPLEPTTEGLSTCANGTGSGEGQRTLPRAMWFLPRSHPGQDGTLCQVSLSTSTAICN